MFYALNKANSRTKNTEPSLTDQSQARETDINVIVGRFGVSGQMPGTGANPMYGDFSNFPEDLRTMIETARSIDRLRGNLPDALKKKSIEELMALTPDELTNILTPPAPTPDNGDNTNA